jgi:hypothetical protein
MATVCAIKKVAWSVDGMTKTASPGTHLPLLPAVAAAALKAGAVCEMTDPRQKFFADQKSPYTPLLENCIGLDDAAKAAVAAAIAEPRGIVEPIRRSRPPGVVDTSLPPRQLAAARNNPFEVIDRGPSYKITTSKGDPQPGPKGEDDK